MPNDFMTIKDAARALGYEPHKVYNALATWEGAPVPERRIGRYRMIDVSALRAMLEARGDRKPGRPPKVSEVLAKGEQQAVTAAARFPKPR